MNQSTPTPPPDWLVTALDAHRQWVAEKYAQQPGATASGPPGMRATPSQLRLHDVDLTDVAMPGAILAGAVLTRIGLAGAHLEAVDFSDARLTEVDLTGVRADRATFYDAVLTNCVLARAGLSGADLAAASLHGCRLAGADLTGAALTKAQLYECDLTEAKLDRARAYRASIIGGRSPGRAWLAPTCATLC
ncbi:MAG TPA: pentapeptide repeat-containing protein [Bradyrhizobium sp.]|jgi:uncharacterized protein YjbI with pentapeptide repeats|nr:pentapeptide repeat-containing protein [Bradyrhizobium sp.]